MAKKRSFREFKQGVFKPINKDKCLNKTEIVYRSGLERSVMIVLDKNVNVIKWGSENVVIPYFKPIEERMARYFVDFYIEIKIGEEIKKYIVEVKPHSQLTVKPHGNKKTSTILYENIQFAVNKAKWEAAEKWAKNKGMEFLIITEKNIDSILGKDK